MGPPDRRNAAARGGAGWRRGRVGAPRPGGMTGRAPGPRPPRPAPQFGGGPSARGAATFRAEEAAYRLTPSSGRATERSMTDGQQPKARAAQVAVTQVAERIQSVEDRAADLAVGAGAPTRRAGSSPRTTGHPTSGARRRNSYPNYSSRLAWATAAPLVSLRIRVDHHHEGGVDWPHFTS